MATGGGKQPTFRTARAQRTVRPLGLQGHGGPSRDDAGACASQCRRSLDGGRPLWGWRHRPLPSERRAATLWAFCVGRGGGGRNGATGQIKGTWGEKARHERAGREGEGTDSYGPHRKRGGGPTGRAKQAVSSGALPEVGVANATRARQGGTLRLKVGLQSC